MKYGKLVRDKIKDIIEENGEKPIIRILNEEDYKNELFKKLNEETNELLNAKTKDEISEECSDVLEVLFAIASLEGMNEEEIMKLKNLKRNKRGAFEKRMFLEGVE